MDKLGPLTFWSGGLVPFWLRVVCECEHVKLPFGNFQQLVNAVYLTPVSASIDPLPPDQG